MIYSMPPIHSEHHPHCPVFPPLMLSTERSSTRYHLCHNRYSTTALPKAPSRDQSIRVLRYFQPRSLLQRSSMAQPSQDYVDYYELLLVVTGKACHSGVG